MVAMFDTATANPGTGGLLFAVDSWDDGGTTHVLPYGGVAFGSINGPYTVVDVGSGLPIDIRQLGGVSTAVNAGAVNSGTLRVVIATDQPQLSSKLLVTPDLPTGASTAAKQPALGIAGTASSDVITVQGVSGMTKLLVTPDSVALPANQSVNVNQLAGTTTSVNSGVKDAGTQRVVIATDQPALSNKLLVTPDLPSGASTAAKQPALGTAGVPSADVLTIQGVTSMTKLLVTPDSVALPANQSVNVNQLAGTTTSVNSGAKDAGTQRVVIATDQPALSNKLLVTPDLPSGASTAAKQPALGVAGTASSDVLTIQGISGMTKLLVTPDSVALPANQSTNMAQVAGTATSVNSGVKDAGTQRVVIATDQPQLTAKLLVTPDSVALPANQSVNMSQVAGTNTSVNSGVKDAGTQRVVLATDQPQLTAKLLVTPDSVALPAHQSVNLDQWNGTAPTTAALLADSTALPTAPLVGSVPMLYDGTNLKLQRGLVPMTLLASGARTSNTNTSVVTNVGAKGFKLFVSVTAGTTISLTPAMNSNDNLGTGYQIWVAATAITSTGTYVYEFYPGLGTAVQQNVKERLSVLVDYSFYFIIIHNNANSTTYSVCGLLFP